MKAKELIGCAAGDSPANKLAVKNQVVKRLQGNAVKVLQLAKGYSAKDIQDVVGNSRDVTLVVIG